MVWLPLRRKVYGGIYGRDIYSFYPKNCSFYPLTVCEKALDVMVRTNEWNYACWIGPDNQVRGRAPDILQNELGAYQQGYVKVHYKDSAMMRLSGTLSAINQSRERWLALAHTINAIEINFFDTMNCKLQSNDAFVFKYPEELPDLDKLITE